MDGDRHHRHLVGDRDDERAVFELADEAVRRDPAFRVGQQAVPGRQVPRGELVDFAEVGRLPVHLDHPDRAHRRAEQRDPEQLAHRQDPQRQRQHPQLHDRVQAGLVVGHDHARGGGRQVPEAADGYPRPCSAQPHSRPPSHHPVGDRRVGPGRAAAPGQHRDGRRGQHARGERRHRAPGHPSTASASGLRCGPSGRADRYLRGRSAFRLRDTDLQDPVFVGRGDVALGHARGQRQRSG
jgi:hypothetical protein